MRKFLKFFRKLKLFLLNINDIKYLRFKKDCGNNGIILVIHESKKLGASILLKNIADEMVKQGQEVYIISRTFGELNDEYSAITNTQVALTRLSFKIILKKLKNKGYSKILFNTAVCGDLVNIAKNLDYKVLSLIHELEYVIKTLKIEKETTKMLSYSDEIIFSTTIARDEILNYLNLPNKNIKIRPQGVYFKKPSLRVIEKNKNYYFEKYPFLKNHKIVIGVGNTTYRKGFDLFFETSKKMKNIYFLWCGKKENYYNEVISNSSFSNKNFIYLGMLNSEQLSGLYAIADVLLMSSRKDTLPSVIMEALSFNVPVVGSCDSGGIVDIVDRTNGFITDSCDSDKFVSAIENVLKDEKKDLSKSIRELSFENYVSYLIYEIYNLN